MSRNDVTFWVFIVVMMFLFWGEPDVFDSLRAAAMNVSCGESNG